jgi:glycosyltransferase involved in cell wall biosynthesis
MNVLHIVPSITRRFGGPTRSLASFAWASRCAGVHVTVASTECDPREAAWFKEHAGGVDLHLFPCFGSHAFRVSPALHRWLRREGGRFDAIHVHGLLSPLSSWPARICIQRGWPVVIQPFGTMSQYTFKHRRRWLKRAYFRLIDAPNLARAAGVLFTTDDDMREATLLGIGFSGRDFVIPPCWVPEVEPRDVPTVSRPTAVILSRLHPVKNLEAVLRVWPAVLRRVPSAYLRIAGDGDANYVARLQAMAHATTRGDSVEFIGFVQGDEKAALLKSGTAFVLSSYHENFGYAVLEALAAGLPVVVTSTVGLASFVQARRLGFVVDASDEQLTDAMVRALTDSELQQRARGEALSLVQADFAPSRVGAQLRAMYDRIL